jgi:hypothetical protein
VLAHFLSRCWRGPCRHKLCFSTTGASRTVSSHAEDGTAATRGSRERGNAASSVWIPQAFDCRPAPAYDPREEALTDSGAMWVGAASSPCPPPGQPSNKPHGSWQEDSATCMSQTKRLMMDDRLSTPICGNCVTAVRASARSPKSLDLPDVATNRRTQNLAPAPSPHRPSCVYLTPTVGNFT